MADSVATPPPAPAINIVPAPQVKTIKAGGEIKLGGGSKTPVEAPKAGTEREQMNSRLKKLAAQAPEPESPATPPVAPEVPEIDPEAPEAPETPETPEKPAKETTPPTPEDKKKVSPWKLKEHYQDLATKNEARAIKAESELSAIKRGELPKELQDRISKAEARAKELEDEIRFVSYEKSPEFKEKFDAPYVKAWENTMSRLGRVIVTQPDGQQRYAKADDIIEIINLPPDKAIERAEEVFGKLGNWVAERAEHINNLFSQRQAGLEEGKKMGATREQQVAEALKETDSKIANQIATDWEKFQQATIADEKNGRFFTPREGDDNWNERLEKGFAFVDESMAMNPLDKKITAEQRSEAVKRHNAIRNRAAAFGPLKYQITTLESKVAELEKELAQFKSSEPQTGGTRQQASNGQAEDTRTSMFNRLRNKAAA